MLARVAVDARHNAGSLGYSLLSATFGPGLLAFERFAAALSWTDCAVLVLAVNARRYTEVLGAWERAFLVCSEAQGATINVHARVGPSTPI